MKYKTIKRFYNRRIIYDRMKNNTKVSRVHSNKTRKQRLRKKMKGGSNTKVILFNWWDLNSEQERETCIALFEKLLSGCIDGYDEIHIYSVYPIEAQIPPLDPLTKVLRIQYSGEGFFKDPSRVHVNCIPGEHPTTNNFVIFPHMSFYMNSYNINASDFIIPRKYKSAQPKFCLFSVSNGGVQERNNFYNELSKYKTVDSCGKFMNNLGYNCPGNFASKEYHDMLSQYKFMICFENKSMKNYLTEKLINAYKYGTIPIYWGCPNLEDYVNMDAILYLKPGYTDDDVKTLIKEIEILDNDPELYKKKYESVFFKNGVVPDSFNMEKLNLEMCKRITSLDNTHVLKGGNNSSNNLFVISGNARTIMKCIDNQYNHLITKLFSSEPNAKLYVYMHIKLTDPGPKGHPDFNHEYPPVIRQVLLKKIEDLMKQYPHINIYHTILDGEEISENDLFSQVKERSRFKNHLGEDKFLKRSMFIHYNYERCGINIVRLQKENNCVYDTFIYIRPDVYITEDCYTIDKYNKDKVTISQRNANPNDPCLGGTGLIYIIPKRFFKNFFVDIMNIYRGTAEAFSERLEAPEYVAAAAMPYEVAKISNPIILRK
jgi:hypothetical protein